MNTKRRQRLLLWLLALTEAEKEDFARKNRRTCYVRPINRTRNARGEIHVLVADMNKFCDAEWKKAYYRMSDAQVEDIIERVTPFLERRRTHKWPISVEARVKFTIMTLASGNSIRINQMHYRIGRSTAYAVFHETCIALWKALHSEFMPRPTKSMWEKAELEFRERWNFPGCLGAVDGKHVFIQKPLNAGSEYFCYKKQHSIVLMAVVDASYCFMYIDVGAFGSSNDSSVLERSTFGKALYDSTNPLELPGQFILPNTDIVSNHVFIGDGIFSIGQRLLKPYSANCLPVDCRIFNYRLSRARRVVENAFGIMASRWRILRKPMAFGPVRVANVVKATCVLHNFLIKTSEGDNAYIPPGFTDSDGNLQDGQWRKEPLPANVFGQFTPETLPQRSRTHIGMALRNQLKDYFMSAEGAVEWQMNKI